MPISEIETPKVGVPWGKIIISVVLSTVMFSLINPIKQIGLQFLTSHYVLSILPKLLFLPFLPLAFFIGIILKNKIIRYGSLVLVINISFLAALFIWGEGFHPLSALLFMGKYLSISFLSGILLSALINKYARKAGIIISVIFAVLLISLSGYALFNTIYPPHISLDYEKITELTAKLTAQVTNIEISHPSIDSGKILRDIPEHASSPERVTHVDMSGNLGSAYAKNGLFINAKKDYDKNVLISQILAVGAMITSYNPSLEVYSISFPEDTSYEQFFAAENALLTSSQISSVLRKYSAYGVIIN